MQTFCFSRALVIFVGQSIAMYFQPSDNVTSIRLHHLGFLHLFRKNAFYTSIYQQKFWQWVLLFCILRSLFTQWLLALSALPRCCRLPLRLPDCGDWRVLLGCQESRAWDTETTSDCVNTEKWDQRQQNIHYKVRLINTLRYSLSSFRIPLPAQSIWSIWNKWNIVKL